MAGQGDDAALLAGATLAAFDQPGAYDTITARLDEALDASFASDPIWGTPTPDRSFVITELLPDDSPALQGFVTIGWSAASSVSVTLQPGAWAPPWSRRALPTPCPGR